MKRPTLRLGAVPTVLLAMGLMGCPNCLFKEKRFEHQEDAASTHVSVLAVAPFPDYLASLQPKFSLTADQALTQVVPTTRSLEEKFLDALLLTLKVAPPTSSIATTETATEGMSTADGASSSSKRTVTTQRGPGDLSQVPSTSDSRGSASTAALGPPADLSVLKTVPAVEPMLRYAAANALFQEVQILNRYVRDHPTRGDYVPYVVRLQVSVMPMARHIPYDVFVDMAFFCSSESGPGKELKDASSVPEVVPMLVTDNLEATLHSKSLDQVRQISMALAAMIQGFGISAESQRRLESLQTALGRDLNSLMTVGKLSQNILRVRLGASQEVQANHALVSQTHNVTLLLLVPKEHRTVRLRANTRMRDAIHGCLLTGRDEEEVKKAHRNILEKFASIAGRGGRVFDAKTEDLEDLMSSAVSGDVQAFNRKLAGLLKKKETMIAAFQEGAAEIDALSTFLWWRDVLWEDLVAFALGNRFSLATFDLPEVKEPKLPGVRDPKPAVLDTDDTARVFLPGGENLRQEALAVWLVWNGKEFAARSIRVSDSGRDLTIEFPSIARFVQNDNVPVEVRLNGPGTQRLIQPCAYFRVLDTKAPGFSLEITSPKLDVVENKAQITVTVTFPDDRGKGPESATVSLRGAVLDRFEALEGAVPEVKGGKLVVKANARLRMTVSNVDDVVLVEAVSAKDVRVPPITLQSRRNEKKEPKQDK